MTDHADTIRRLITDWWDCDISKDAEAQALFAWVAERQQAQQELSDAAVVYADLMTKLNEAAAERQQAIDERDAQKEIVRQMRFELDAAHTIHVTGVASEREKHLEARCEQAIDALREAFAGLDTLTGYTHSLTDGCEPSRSRGQHFTAHVDSVKDILRAALLSLGEQP